MTFDQGYAYTFITEDQARYAGDIIKALELSGNPIPPDLEKLWADFKEQQKAVSNSFFCRGLGPGLMPVHACVQCTCMAHLSGNTCVLGSVCQ